MKKRIITYIWLIPVLFVLITFIGVVGVKNGWIGNMPPLDDLQNPINRFASQVISSDGKVLGTWSKSENRIFVDHDSISSHMFDALVATEDVRFFEHSGIDVRALGRAIVKTGIMQQKSAGGGSTITQQLAKQLYSERASNKLERLMQKPIEWIIAVELERCYTKDEILTLYLNYFDFLHNAVGIKTAALVYFSKHPRDLTLTESALLVGMCKNPSYYNPVRYPERALNRRAVVLDQMVKAGYITEAECEQAKTQPLGLNFHRVDHKEGSAPYLREYLRRFMMADRPDPKDYGKSPARQRQYYEDSLNWETNPLYGWCKKNFKKDGSPYDIYTDGLKIYVTIDSRMQRYAEEAMLTHVGRDLQKVFSREKRNSPNFPYPPSLSREKVERFFKHAMQESHRYRQMKEDGADEATIERAFNTPVHMTIYAYGGERDTVMTPMDSLRYQKSMLRSGLMSIDPATGFVKAYVGGLNYKYFQHDMCAVGRRQVGSTMKPYVYAMAMQDGHSPCDMLTNAQRTYHTVNGSPWTPRNGSHARYGQQVTLKWGLSQSNNWITADLMNNVDPTGNRLVKLLRDFGVADNQIRPSIVLCLGACEITVAEMASGYTAFANKGIRCAPIFVSHIEDANGNVVAEFRPRMNEVISEESSYKMIEMMRGVIDAGTGRRLRNRYGFTGPIAGKTGTTNNNADGWFVGVVPRLVTACWVGGEDPNIRFYTTASGQGAATALPVWALYMKRVYADTALGYLPNEPFDIPADFQSCDEGIGFTLNEETDSIAGFNDGVDMLFE